MSEHSTEHTRVDHGADNLDPTTPLTPGPTVLEAESAARMDANKVLCEACPVLCHISAGRTGACDRWGNVDGVLTRIQSLVLMRHGDGDPEVPQGDCEAPAIGHGFDSGGVPSTEAGAFVTGVGAGTTYPDYKPAPFIVASRHEGVDMVTVVTEGIFSYCSFKVKIDTDRFLGPEQANIRHQREVVGHVTTAEYGSQMLSIGGVHHLTGGSRKEGRATCDVMAALGNKETVELMIDGGASIVVQAGRPPVVNGVPEDRMRVGCGSATIGIFAKQWLGIVDEVVVVDDHITGVLTEHQAGRCLGMRPSGIEMKGRRSTAGRYFKVANPGAGWGGTDLADPLSIIGGFDGAVSWPGLRLLMVSTTGEHAAYFVLDESLRPQAASMPQSVQRVVERIAENCEAALATVLFMGGAGGSLRAGVTDSPVELTRAIKRALVNVTCGGAPAYVWPGGGITIMVDVSRMPEKSFGTVPTPAVVAPIEFTMRRADYTVIGGHVSSIKSLRDVLIQRETHLIAPNGANPWPLGGRALLG